MKNLLSLFALGLALLNTNNSLAESSSTNLINSTDLKNYQNAIDFLTCEYKTENGNCTGFNSTNSARKLIQELAGKTATGLNVSKKDKLDALAEGVLPLISKAEAKEYMEYIAKLGSVDFVNEMDDSAKIYMTFTMPNELALANAEASNFEEAEKQANKGGYETMSTVMTKAEMLASAQETGIAAEEYSSEPAYKQGVEHTTEEKNVNSYEILENGTLAQAKSEKEKVSVGMAMKTYSDAILDFRRYKVNNYEIKITRQEIISKNVIESELYSEDKLPVYNIDVNKKFDDPNNVDDNWVFRYEEEELADAKERRRDANYMMLEYVVEKAEEIVDEAEHIHDETERQNYLSEVPDILEKGVQFYDALKEFPDDKEVQSLTARYLKLKRI